MVNTMWWYCCKANQLVKTRTGSRRTELTRVGNASSIAPQTAVSSSSIFEPMRYPLKAVVSGWFQGAQTGWGSLSMVEEPEIVGERMVKI
jgi:hypothetical protein